MHAVTSINNVTSICVYDLLPKIGDEGVVKPGGRTARTELDADLRWQWGKYVFLNGDCTCSQASAMDEAKGNNDLPLASRITFAGGIRLQLPSGLAGQ